jgi:REP element-mobilizing transposase RayT
MFVTWRLEGTLPHGRSFPRQMESGKAFVAMDRLLDEAWLGPAYLRIPEIAACLDEAIRSRDQRVYALHAYVVMSNHVHLLITPFGEMRRILHSLKSFTARQANRLLGRGGPFWTDGSYDRLVRNAGEFERICDYIEKDPVVAGLAAMPDAFPYSSARADLAIGPQVWQPAPPGEDEMAV